MDSNSILWAVLIGGGVSAVRVVHTQGDIWHVVIATFAVGAALYLMALINGEFAGTMALLFMVTSLVTNGGFLISALDTMTGVKP